MSDLLLRGLSLPKFGYREIRIHPDGRVIEEDECGLDEHICTAIQVADHGRLIEADDLYDSCVLDPCIDVMASAKRINEYMQLKIDNAPTVIPASE